MYLKGIEIHGFKSFGEKVYIEFNRGLTSIVGPNGSGKSNILDAVLWVLGEQSYKNIRAKESSDVIFSGGKDRKAMSFAEVSLFIDNSDFYLPIEKEELKITRKLHSSGENEYFINDIKSRLKDVGNLFLDTGIGKSAYSVIGQGKVERIIGSSSKEIKNIIEEAAGIKKFQIQKNEALKNLENLDNELEKIFLVLKEVKENTGKVQKQAEKALEYLELKKERDFLAKSIYMTELHTKTLEKSALNEKKEKSDSEKNEIEKKLEDIEIKLSQIEKEREDIRLFLEKKDEINRALNIEINNKEREKAISVERISSYSRELDEKKNQILVFENKIVEKENSLSQLIISQNKIAQETKVLKEENKKFEELLNSLEEKRDIFKTQEESRKKKIIDLELDKMRVLNEIENSTRKIRGSVIKIESIKKDMQEYEEKLTNSTKELQEISQKKEILEKNIIDTQNRGKFLEDKISEISQKINKLSEQTRNAEYDEKRFSAKLQALLRLEENNEGFFRGVKEVLNSNIEGIEGVFISLINIPEKYEKAIEAGVPGNIQDIIVKNSDVAKKAIALLKEKRVGKASFLALDTIKVSPVKKIDTSIKGVIGIASTLVETEEKYKIVADFVLGNLLVVENIDIALNILKKNLFSGNIVTLSGELMSSRGRITGGEASNSTASMLFERKKEIKLLKEKTAELSKILQENSLKQENFSKELENFENEIDKIDSLEEEYIKNARIVSQTYNDCQVRNEKLKKDISTLKIELDEENRYNNEFEKKISNFSTEKEKIEEFIKLLKIEQENGLNELSKLENEINEKRNSFADKKIIFLNNSNKIEQFERELEKAEKEKVDLILELEDNKRKIISLENSIGELNSKNEFLNKEIEEKKQLFKFENEEIFKNKEKDILLGQEERNYFNEKKELGSKLLIIQDGGNKIDDKLYKLSFAIDRLNENLQPLIDIEGKLIENEIFSKKQSEFSKLDYNFKNFPTVNLLAVEEFEELNKKYQFLSTQKDDLVQGKDTLLNLISEIDTNIQDRFFNAFKEIDENFNKMCVETLNNSEGKLILTDKDNFDNCGVEIFVKFKNKKRQSLSLLSGGEKSMVAIAFIMGIFMYKPSPFTFLDEIEAALDEKNTRKLISKLKEFVDKSQFILITHNKDTMRESESIFGVTMNKEIGISKIVPVKF